jgi:hypothetical protein
MYCCYCCHRQYLTPRCCLPHALGWDKQNWTNMLYLPRVTDERKGSTGRRGCPSLLGPTVNECAEVRVASFKFEPRDCDEPGLLTRLMALCKGRARVRRGSRSEEMRRMMARSGVRSRRWRRLGKGGSCFSPFYSERVVGGTRNSSKFASSMVCRQSLTGQRCVVCVEGGARFPSMEVVVWEGGLEVEEETKELSVALA